MSGEILKGYVLLILCSLLFYIVLSIIVNFVVLHIQIHVEKLEQMRTVTLYMKTEDNKFISFNVTSRIVATATLRSCLCSNVP